MIRRGCAGPGTIPALRLSDTHTTPAMIINAKLLFASSLALTGLTATLQDSADVWTQAELEAATLTIQAQIEELRGQKFLSPVAVEATDEKGLIEYAKARLETTETDVSMHADEMTMKQLGLLAADRNFLEETFSLLEGQVGGFYDPGTDSFYLMDRFTGGLAKIILAHELTHALDDQLYDIDGTLHGIKQSTDSELAYHAVVEGSGLGTMYDWMKAHPTEWNVNDLTGMQALTSGLDDAPAAVWKPLLASYWLGGAFLNKTDKWRSVQMTMSTPSVEAVAAAFKNPPRSTEQLLHPEKYWNEALVDEPIDVAFSFSELPQGWSAVAEDTLGEFYLALVATPAKERESVNMSDPQSMLAMNFTNAAAEGWGGDRMVLLESESSSILRLVTTWDTSEDAAEFYEAINKAQDDIEKQKAHALTQTGMEVEAAGKVVVVTSYSGVDAEQLAGVLECVSHTIAKPELGAEK